MKFVGHAGRVKTLALHPDGTLMASGGFDYTILLWKLEAAYPACTAERPESAIPTVRPLTRVDAHKGHIMGLRFKPAAAGDARSYLASCSNDHSLKVWSVRKSGSSYSLSTHWSADDVHESCVSAVCWGKAAGANTLFSSSWDRSVCMFDLNPTIVSGQAEPKVPPLLAHAARVTDMDVTKTGQFLVTVSVDVTAVVWDIAAGCKPLVKYKMSVTNGFPSAVSAGTNVFVSASGFGQIMVWPLPVPAYVPHALRCTVNTRGHASACVRPEATAGACDIISPWSAHVRMCVCARVTTFAAGTWTRWRPTALLAARRWSRCWTTTPRLRSTRLSPWGSDPRSRRRGNKRKTAARV